MIYFDHASTSYPKPLCMSQAISDYLAYVGVSPSRGSHRLSRQAQKLVVETKEMVCQLFHDNKPQRYHFCSNATHGLNMVIQGFLGQGDEVVTTSFEHNSVIRPLNKLVQEKNITVKVIFCDKDGHFQIADFADAITKKTKLVILNHASNVIGIKIPIAKIIEIAKKKGAYVLLDVSQTAGVVDINLPQLDVDFIVMTGHKGLNGPSGIGLMYIKDHTVLNPLLVGGTGDSSLVLNQPTNINEKFEVGTSNYIGIAGLHAALKDRLTASDYGLSNILNVLHEIYKELKAIHNIELYGFWQDAEKIPVLAFNIEKMLPQEVAGLLDIKYSIMVRAGIHCAPLLHRAIGTYPNGSVRISLGPNNTSTEACVFLKAIKKIIENRSRS